MGDPSDDPAKAASAAPAGGRGSWFAWLARAQVSNAAAERMGSAPAWLCALVLLATVSLTTFPLAYERWHTAIASSDPGRYPEIGLVLRSLAAKDWGLAVEKGALVAGPGAKGFSTIGSWEVAIEPAGGEATAVDATPELGKAPDRRVLFLGRYRNIIYDGRSGNTLAGNWEQLEGFRLASLAEGDVARKATAFLYAAATGGVRRDAATVSVLMGVQVLFMTGLLGFLLSLSKVKAAGSGLNPPRAAGFRRSLKTAVATGLGPALLVAAALYLVPGSGQLGWVLFTLLYGGRIVFVYMARFKDKARKVPR